MSPNSSAITFRCVSVNVESLSLEPPVRDTIHSGDVILVFLLHSTMMGLARNLETVDPKKRGPSASGVPISDRSLIWAGYLSIRN
ncbi:hypothetical protein Tco_0103145 [Tanacetum coccineum]